MTPSPESLNLLLGSPGKCVGEDGGRCSGAYKCAGTRSRWRASSSCRTSGSTWSVFLRAQEDEHQLEYAAKSEIDESP
jgi:hypothetical protein